MADEAPGCWGRDGTKDPLDSSHLSSLWPQHPPPPETWSSQEAKWGLGKEGVGRQCHADSLQGIYYFFT